MTLLFQHVKEPTRFRHGQNPSLIDLTFTNEEGMVDEITYLPGLGNSDHACLCFIFKCDKQVQQEFMPTYNFSNVTMGVLVASWMSTTGLLHILSSHVV